MKTKTTLHRAVLDWYEANARDLPWRTPGVPAWWVLISEVMLQQTPVSRVLPVYAEWTARWPTPKHLAEDSPGEAVRAWGRLGYPRRALRLHEAATAIVTRHDGEVPNDHAALLALPGVGSYTAAAVASFAFRGHHAVLDTNVRRVFARAVSGRAQPPPALTAAETLLAESLLPEPGVSARWAVAVMELGALVCTARVPRCDRCPLHDVCAWRSEGYPPYDGPVRRPQSWHGTDRQVRGRLLATLRDAEGPVPGALLRAAVPDADLSDPHQRDRCLAGLITDGLVDPLPDDAYALPA